MSVITRLHIICLLLAITSSASAEPSKQETIDYIINNNSNFVAEHKNGGNWFAQKIKFNPTTCDIEFKHGFPTYNFNLKDIDPNEISGNEDVQWVYISCREKKKCISGKNPENTWKDDYYSYKTNKTTRIAKAFSNLVKLCGGKAELF